MATKPNYSYTGPAPGAIQSDTMFRAPQVGFRTAEYLAPQGDMRQYGRTGAPAAMQGQHRFFKNSGGPQPQQGPAPVSETVQPVEQMRAVESQAAPAPNPIAQGMSMFASRMGQAQKADDGIRVEGEVDYGTKARDAIMGLFGKKVDPVAVAKKSAGMGDQVKAALKTPMNIGMFR